MNMKKLIPILILVLSVTHNVGCSSGSEDGDSDQATADAEESGDESSEDSEDLDAQAAEGEESTEEGGEEGEEIADEGGEGGEAEGGQEGSDDVIADLGEGEGDSAPPADAASNDSAAPAPDTSTEQVADAPPPEVPDQSTSDVAAEAPVDAPIASFIPLKKIKDTPFKSNGRLMNTVYVARPGDSVSSISQKLFGDDRSEVLKQDNSILASRGPKPGDKIYYNSPKRPDDASTMLTYYEDKGIAPQIYVTKDGDNIRDFASQLLGHPNAWKEVWATNMNLESKDVVPPGVELKYWPSDAGASSTLPQEPPVAADSGSAPPPPEQFAQNTMPPPPPVDSMPPPPPPPMEMPPDQGGGMGSVDAMAPPPPPPPPPPRQKGLKDNLDEETTMALGVAGVLFLAAAALFMMIMKNKRSKKIKLSQTQV